MKIASCMAVGGMLLLAFAAHAAEPGVDPRAATADAAPGTETDATSGEPAAGAAGMRAALDPYTRELIEPGIHPAAPKGGEAVTDALAPMDYNKVIIEHLPDGNVHIDLNGQVRMTAFARLDADGTATTWCAPGTHSDLAKRAPAAPADLEAKP